MKKVYSAPLVEVVPIAVENCLLNESSVGPNGANYAPFLWDSLSQDSEGFSIWQ